MERGRPSVPANRADPTTGHCDSSSSSAQPLVVWSHSGDPARACSCEIHVEDGPTGPIFVLSVAGEIDSLTIPTVQTAMTNSLATVWRHRPGDLVVDLAGVGFCCVRGFHVLADAEYAARAAGMSFALSGLNDHLQRIVTLLWPAGRLLSYRSAAAAVTAVRIDQTYRRAPR